MKQLSKSYSFQNNGWTFLCALIFSIVKGAAQQGNLVSNGSFEENYNCDEPSYPISIAKSWSSVDSSIFTFAGVYQHTCNVRVPVNASGFQFPSSGNAYIRTTLYCLLPSCGRGYMKNRLKATLKQGKTYCIKFYISIANESPRGMDGFGIYFGDGAIDTIKYSNIPLTYINPQVKNPIGNVITDTLNWTSISGTFVANGTEKYALIGNFLADNAVTTASINTPSYPQYWTDVYVDDVSCIEFNLPAYAGPDKSVAPGDSVYIGRENDFAIDSGCTWYQLPNLTMPIKKISGLWVKPVVTTTYVVRQILDCSAEKWDTVAIYMNPVGLVASSDLGFKGEIKIYPVPAQEYLVLKITSENSLQDFNRLTVLNNLGEIIREEQLTFKNGKVILKTNDLADGIYFLKVNKSSNGTIIKRFIICH